MIRKSLVLLLGVVLSLGATQSAQAQFGGFRLPKIGGGGPKIQFGRRSQGQSSPSHSILPFQPKKKPGSSGPKITIPGFGGGFLPKPKNNQPGVQPLPFPIPKSKGPKFGIPGIGDLFKPKPTPGVPPLPSPLPSPKPKPKLPPLIIPLVLGPPPFICPTPPCPPRPILPAPLPPAPVEPAEGAQPPERKKSEIERVAEAAKKAFQNEDYDQAMKLANRMNDLAPKNGGVLQFRAAVYVGQTKYPEAAIDVYNAVVAGPIWTKVNVKDVYGDPTAYSRDMKWLTSATVEQPEVLAHQFLSAYHALVRDDKQAGERHLRKMLELKPNEPVATKLLERMHAVEPGEGVESGQVAATK